VAVLQLLEQLLEEFLEQLMLKIKEELHVHRVNIMHMQLML
jgi:hypothetical protein